MATGKNRGFLIIQRQLVVKDCSGRRTDVKLQLHVASGGVNQLDLLVELVRVFISHSRTTFHRDIHQKTDLLLFLRSCVYILFLR